MKKAFLLMACCFMLTGCWDRAEIKKIGLVMGIAIDKDKDTGEFVFTTQMLRPSALSVQSASSSPPFEEVVVTGKTIFDTIRKSNQEFDRKGFYAHNKIILVSEELAREGMLHVLDSFQRGKEIRGYVFICITKNAPARDILETNSNGIETIPVNHLKSMIENTKFQFNATSIDLLNFYKESLGSGIEPVVGVLEFEENKYSKKHVKLSGGAVFNKDKLVGFLDEKETRGYRWGKGEVKTGVISIPSIIDENRFESVEVNKASAKITPKVKGDDISFTIDVSGEGIIVEQQSTEMFKNQTEKVEYMKKVEDKIIQIIDEEINLAVEKTQKELYADIFGFGSALNKKYPKTWNKVKMDWNETYTNVPYDVKVDFKLNHSGLMTGPFQPEN